MKALHVVCYSLNFSIIGSLIVMYPKIKESFHPNIAYLRVGNSEMDKGSLSLYLFV